MYSAFAVFCRLNDAHKIMLTNERLIAEMKRLLKVFPHGVIIEAKNDSSPMKIKLVNRNFTRQISRIDGQLATLQAIKVRTQATDRISAEGTDSLFDLLRRQTQKLKADSAMETTKVTIQCRGDPEASSEGVVSDKEELKDEQLLQRQRPVQKSSNAEVNIVDNDIDSLKEPTLMRKQSDDSFVERIFNIKSIHVLWEGQPSFMHVFIDTTDIFKLEEATNNIKCQKIMFASVSHEFRTPLNAISNSYSFIQD